MSRDAQRAALGHSKPAVEPAVQDAEVGWLPSREVPGKECSNQGQRGAKAAIYVVTLTVVGVDLTRPRFGSIRRLRPAGTNRGKTKAGE